MGDSWEKVTWSKQFFHDAKHLKDCYQSPYALAESKAVVPLRGWQGNLMVMELDRVIAHGGQGTVLSAHLISNNSSSTAPTYCVKATPWKPSLVVADLNTVEADFVGRLAARLEAAGKDSDSLKRDMAKHTFLPVACGWWNNYVWTAMEMGSQNLESFWLDKRKRERFIKEADPRQRIEAAMAVGEEIARGATALHRLGYSNNDEKPANAMITNHRTVAIGDIGIAVELDAQYDITGHLGTKNWAAPELFCSKPVPHPNTDSFGVAAIVISFATGLPPSSRFDKEINDRSTPFADKYVDATFHAFGHDIAPFLLRGLYTSPEARPSVLEQLEFFRGKRTSSKSHVLQVNDLVEATDLFELGVSQSPPADLTAVVATKPACEPAAGCIRCQHAKKQCENPPPIKPSALKKNYAKQPEVPKPPAAAPKSQPLRSMSAEQLDALVSEAIAKKGDGWKELARSPMPKWLDIGEAVVLEYEAKKQNDYSPDVEGRRLRDQLVFQHVRLFLMRMLIESDQENKQPKQILLNQRFFEDHFGILSFFVWCVTGPQDQVCKKLEQEPFNPSRPPGQIVQFCPVGTSYPRGWATLLRMLSGYPGCESIHTQTQSNLQKRKTQPRPTEIPAANKADSHDGGVDDTGDDAVGGDVLATDAHNGENMNIALDSHGDDDDDDDGEPIKAKKRTQPVRHQQRPAPQKLNAVGARRNKVAPGNPQNL
eukprot:TRINITY_DN131_c0_g1_i1.p1 TRINITY_DN131_c0_g1~~TRINITY_DN131_c0_g1_i1.p1  ORF type:complete len:711 (-),score=129.73 TRINITY_DN131_c0_g1_i1:139-2271(-)